MLNNVISAGQTTEKIANILLGHHLFMLKNTGLTNDSETEHYITNMEYVLSNNRHFIARPMQVYQPNGDATTEGQSLQILGYTYAYLATGYQGFLDEAKKYFDAYIQHFYYGQPIPAYPQRYISNWLVNGKEPVPSGFPINFDAPTNSGYKSVPIMITNGVARIPHGTPFWGEYLDKATFVHRGHNTWESIVANIVNIKEPIDWNAIYLNHRVLTMPAEPAKQRSWVNWNAYLGTTTGYTPDWSSGGDQTPIPVYSAVVFTHEEVNVEESEVIAQGLPTSEIGRLTFEDNTLNGVYLLNYGVRLPEEHGGYILERNKPWHNRPLNVPVATNYPAGGPKYNQMGNASDAEQWFGDAAYLLWKLTGDDKYKRVWDCVRFTVSEYVLIDAEDKYFRQSTQATIPFTDGISYDFTYPSETTVKYSRDAQGYIVAHVMEEADLSLEQQTIWYRVTRNTKIRTTFGGVDIDGNPVIGRIRMVIGVNKTEAEAGVPLIADLPPSTTTALQVVDIPVGRLVRENKADGSPYLIADRRGLSPYGGAVSGMEYDTSIYGGYVGNIVKAFFPNDDAGMVVDWSYLDKTTQPLHTVLYKSDGEFDMRIVDANGYRWYWILPDTQGAWSNFTLDPTDMVFSGWQPNHPDDPEPAGAVFTEVEDFTIILENGSDTNKTIYFYCVNDLPAQYDIDDGFTFYYRLTVSGETEFTARIGDCYCIDQRDDPLAYTPGVVPFSNIYEEGAYEIGSWRGMPYPGYQHPLVFALDDDKTRYLNNMVNFMYDSQEVFHQRFGYYGPGMSAYIWNRWDNYKYGDPDSWTMYHWGDGHAWSGYQPRAYASAARGLYELMLAGKPIPPKLVTYVDRWTTFLGGFMTAQGASPTLFEPDGTVIGDKNDFTPHMCALWLTGACFSKLAQSTNVELDGLIDKLVKELAQNYQITDIPNHVMNGTWSPAQRLSTGNGPENNGMFFGFYSGEILRALSLYLITRKIKPGENMYNLVNTYA